MATAQDFAPLNPELQDIMVSNSEKGWIPMDEGSAMKVLWTGPETGRWAVLFRWPKGYVAAAHKHLSAAHTFVLSGSLEVRGGVLGSGDYVYEANGMIHETTRALEDTEYLFICDGPIVFYTDAGISHYLGWEEIERMRLAAGA